MEPTTQDAGNLKLFRRFKRQYQRAKRWYTRYQPTASFHVNFSGVNATGSAKTEFSNEPETAKFWNLMRPFLNDKSSLYFRRVWTVIKTQYHDLVPPGVMQEIEAGIAALDTGLAHLRTNEGKKFHSEKIYQLISASGYFYLDAEKKTVFERLCETPSLGPLLWFEFHCYHQGMFNLISLILSAIWVIDLQPSQDGKGGCCIYCLGTDGPFIAEEHVYPESLGNDEAILPRETVCSACNNIFSALEQYLIEFPPIALLQVTQVAFTKKGKFPKASFQNVTIEKVHPTVVKITNNSPESAIRQTGVLEDGRVKFEGSFTSKDRLDGRKLGRALFKIGLGMLALLTSPDTACQEKYNAARHFILRDTPFSNNLIVVRRGRPTQEITTNIWCSPGNGTLIVICIWGIVFLFNLEEKPIIAFPEHLSDEVIVLPLGI